MAEWLVKLQGHEFDLQTLARQLTLPAQSVIKDDAGYYLRAAEFAGLTDASEVLALARELLLPINGAAMVFEPDYRPVQIDRVLLIRDDGTRQYFLFAEGNIRLRGDTLVATTTLNGVTPPNEPPPPPLSNVELASILAQAEEPVQRALRIFASEHTWVNLYKVFEIIEEDVGGKIYRRG